VSAFLVLRKAWGLAHPFRNPSYRLPTLCRVLHDMVGGLTLGSDGSASEVKIPTLPQQTREGWGNPADRDGQ